MRRVVVVLALLVLALPIGAWATSIVATNDFGSVTISNMTGTNLLGTIGATTISSAQSQLSKFGGFTASAGHALGSVNFTTGVLTSGSISGGGMFAGGGVFDITANSAFAKSLSGCNSCTGSMAIFTGSFLGPVSWILDSKTKQTSVFTLEGMIKGMTWNGHTLIGETKQTISINSIGQGGKGIGHISMGTTMAAPEPGTLGLLGTGLVGIAGIFRRKLTRS